MIPDSFEPYLDTVTPSFNVLALVIGIIIIVCAITTAALSPRWKDATATFLTLTVSVAAGSIGVAVLVLPAQHNQTAATRNPVLIQTSDDDRSRWHVSGNIVEVSNSVPDGFGSEAETTLQLDTTPGVWLLVHGMHLRAPSTGLELDLVCMETATYDGIDFLCQEPTS